MGLPGEGTPVAVWSRRALTALCDAAGQRSADRRNEGIPPPTWPILRGSNDHTRALYPHRQFLGEAQKRTSLIEITSHINPSSRER